MIRVFCLLLFRSIILLTFTASFFGKARDIKAFQRTILSFDLLPEWAAWPFTLLALGSELAIVVAMVLGSRLLRLGFLVTLVLLATFSMALCAVLVRKIDTACNCFGSAQHPVSTWDLARNSGFIMCALVGFAIAQDVHGEIDIRIYGLAVIGALALVIIWINLRSIVKLLAR